MSDKLIEIPIESLPKLRDLYRVDWPAYITACYTVDTCIQWFSKNPNLKDIRILCLNGNWREDGTFIMVRSNTYFFDTLQPSCENLKIALKLIDWSKPACTSCYTDRLRATILQVLGEQKIENISEYVTKMFYVPRFQAAQLAKRVKVPEELILKPLDKSYGKEVFENYPHREEEREGTFELLIEMNPSMGLFSKENGELLAWCLRFEDGSCSMLQVSEKHRGKGYPAYVLAGLCRVLVDKGYDLFGHIVADNSRSMTMCKNYGFEIIGKAYWVWTGHPYHLNAHL